ECADGWARNPVSFGVVGTPVARAAEVRRQDRREAELGLRGLHRLLLVVVPRPACLDGTPEMNAAIRDQREAREVLKETVVAHERCPSGDLAQSRVEREGRLDPLPLREVINRTGVTRAR